MSRTLIRNGRVIDPSQSLDRVTNVLIEEGRIAAFDAVEDSQDVVIDATGKIVAPGLVDMHVALREPGLEEDETIESGTAAALAGGFTSLACTPDTDPPIDTRGSVEFIQHQAKRANHCNVFIMACVSKGREGQELAEIGQLVQAGAVAFSDADAPVHNAELMRRAFQYCSMFDKVILNPPRVSELARDGLMHDGLVSTVLGLPGIPAAAEDVMIGRDIALAEATGGRLHVMQLSTESSIEYVRRARARDVRVTCEVSPSHFTLTDERLRSFDSNFKIQPPLRTQEDLQACIAALADGTIDVIASNHAPHAVEKKMQELDRAPFGVVGLETTLSVVITHLIEPGHLDWQQALAKLSCNPAEILGIDRGTLQLGQAADVTIIDPQVQWTVDPSQFHSKSRNSAFAGHQLQGRAETVLVGGEVRYQLGAAVAS